MVPASNYDNAAANLKKEALENVKLSDNHISGNIKVSQTKYFNYQFRTAKATRFMLTEKDRNFQLRNRIYWGKSLKGKTHY